MNKATQDFREFARARSTELARLSAAELLALKPEPETVRFGKRVGTLHTTIEPRGNGAVRVVVQGFLEFRWLPGWYNQALEGFYKHPDGSTSPMPDEEFRDFD